MSNITNIDLINFYDHIINNKIDDLVDIEKNSNIKKTFERLGGFFN